MWMEPLRARPARLWWSGGAAGSISSSEARSRVRDRMERDLGAGVLRDLPFYSGMFPDHPRVVRDEYEAVKPPGEVKR